MRKKEDPSTNLLEIKYVYISQKYLNTLKTSYIEEIKRQYLLEKGKQDTSSKNHKERLNKVDIIVENLNETSSPTIEIDSQLDYMEYNEIRGKIKEKT